MRRVLYSKKTRQRKKLKKLDLGLVSKLPEPVYIPFPARISRVIDGDTVEVVFLHGGIVPMKIGIRISGVDTPELRGKTNLEKQAARYVKTKVEELLSDKAKSIHVTFEKWDKYGNRIVGDILFDGTGRLSDYLLLNAYAQIYNGKAKCEWSEASLQDIMDDSCSSQSL